MDHAGIYANLPSNAIPGQVVSSAVIATSLLVGAYLWSSEQFGRSSCGDHHDC
jgi:hypothetical protein